MNLRPGRPVDWTDEEVLQLIKDYIEQYKYSPAVRDLADALPGPPSTSTVYFSLQRLQRKGFIDWIPQKPRTIRLLK
jgi:SOS-response transcriptional repressor LexA